MPDLLVVARALHFASVATLAGLFFFIAFFQEVIGQTPASVALPLRRWMLILGWCSLVLGIGSGAVWFLLLAFDLAGHSWTALIAQSVLWKLLTETQFGDAAIVRLGLLAALSFTLIGLGRAAPRPPRRNALLGSVLGACLVASLAWAGHGSAGSGGAGDVQLAADALHLIAAAAWLGGLPPLLLLLALTRRSADESVRKLGVGAAARFSQLGLISVCVLLASGIINTYFLVGTVPALVGTDYGHLLLLKLLLFAAMVALAATNRMRHLGHAIASTNRDGALKKIERNAGIELALGLAVLLIVGALGTIPPGAHAQPWWPLPWRFNPDAFGNPESRWEAMAGAVLIFWGFAAATLAIGIKRWRWPLTAIALLLCIWGVPRFAVLAAEAFPTSFFVSPTGYSVASIAAGRAVFAEHCVSCHGTSGRGDGPLAAGMQKSPADLTASHIYGHSDGDLFWWIDYGIGQAMPAFAGVLDEAARWNLIDFIHANADARMFSRRSDLALPLPQFDVECGDGTSVSINDFRGKVVHLVFAGAASAERLEELAVVKPDHPTTVVVRLAESDASPFCSTADRNVIETFAIYRGSDQLDGTEFLIDASGWLRAMWFPGREPDWKRPDVLAGVVARIRRTAGTQRPSTAGAGHVHSH